MLVGKTVGVSGVGGCDGIIGLGSGGGGDHRSDCRGIDVKGWRRWCCFSFYFGRSLVVGECTSCVTYCW